MTHTARFWPEGRGEGCRLAEGETPGRGGRTGCVLTPTFGHGTEGDVRGSQSIL